MSSLTLLPAALSPPRRPSPTAGRARRWPQRRAWLLLGCLLAALQALAADVVRAQRPDAIYNQFPYDELKLKGRDEWFKCYPLKTLSNRYNIRIPKTGNLTLQLIDPEDADAEPGQVTVAWRLVEEIRVFERLVLDEAKSLVASQRYDEAFPYFEFLQGRYPDTPGLGTTIQAYLYESAIDLYTKSRLPEALSALEELFRRNPDYAQSPQQTVTTAISSITDRLVGQYVADEDIDSARKMLRRLTRVYGSTRLSSTSKWQRVLEQRAAAKLVELQRQTQAGDYRGAYLTSLDMLRIWPDVTDGRQWALAAAKRYPIVRVGVTEQPSDSPLPRIDDWAGRRATRLRHRLLVEYLEPGPSGGVYRSPFGTIDHADDLSAVYFQLRRSKDDSQQALISSYDLTQRLLELADPESPEYSTTWAGLVSGVEVRNPYEVTIQLRRSHVLPEAHLQIMLDSMASGQRPLSRGGYTQQSGQQETEMQFVLRPEYLFRGGAQPAEVVETLYEHTSDAIKDLERGKLDVIDRLFPADAARLLNAPTPRVKVGAYAEPTLHMLIPNLKNPWLARPSFRRALVYAIPRESILRELLLDNQVMKQAQVVDGPFSLDSYAYDDTVPRMDFDPKLAKLLSLVAHNELKQIAEKKKEDVPEYETLVLGHPPTKVARMVCRSVQAQLVALGLACDLKEFPHGQVRDEDGSCDLVFAEVQMPEPIVDAERLLAADGLSQSTSPYIGMALRRLNRAQDWKDVAARLRELHRATMQDVAVIPLWQIPEHFAYRPGVRGINEGSLNVYQDIEQWQVEPLLLQD